MLESRNAAEVQVTDQAVAKMGQIDHDNRSAAGQQAGRPRGGRSNLRTALVLLSIALVFFVGVIANRYLFN